MAISITIDWISVTAHESFFDGEFMVMTDLQKWEQWELTKGANGYDNGAKHKSGLRAYSSSTRPDMGQHYIYNGSSLAWIERETGKNGINVLKYHVQRGHNVARVDLAIDFIGESIVVQDFIDAYDSGRCVTKSKKASEIKSKGERGHTFYIGSTKKRKKLTRIYDKGAESGDMSDWLRVECQIMGKPATTVCGMINNSTNPVVPILGAIKSIVDFVGIGQWDRLMTEYSMIKIGSQSAKIPDSKNWLINQVFPTMLRVGIDDKVFVVEYFETLIREIDKVINNEL